GRAHPNALGRLHLVGDATVRDHAAGVGAGVDRHAGFAGRADTRPAAGVQRAHVRGIGRVLGRRVGDAGKVLDVDQRRVQCGAAGDHQLDEVVGKPGAVLDAVDAGVDQPGQCVFAEHVRGDPGAVGVCGVDGV